MIRVDFMANAFSIACTTRTFPGTLKANAVARSLLVAGLLLGLAGCAGRAAPDMAAGDPPTGAGSGNISPATLNVARAALEGHNTGMAMGIIDAVLLKYPTNVEALSLKSSVYFDEGQVALAVVQGRAAVAAGSSVPEAHLALGRALDGVDPSQALAQFKLALLEDPTSEPAMIDAAVADDQIGKVDDAVASLTSATTLYPSSRTARLDLGIALSLRGTSDDMARSRAVLSELAHGAGATESDVRAWNYVAHRG